MLSNNSLCIRTAVQYFCNGSITPPGFKFTELHASTLATVLMRSWSTDCSYMLKDYTWQSRVVIEGYSVAYFNRIAAFKALYR